MSTRTRLELSVATACENGQMCVHDRAGHSLSAMRVRLARASPRAWRDAIVTAVGADGWIDLVTLTGESVQVWNHADQSAEIVPNAPVAIHDSFDVLAAGDVWISIVR